MRRHRCKASKCRTPGGARTWLIFVRRLVILSLSALALGSNGTQSLVRAQEVSISLRIPADSPARAVVEGSCAPQTKWSFTDSFGGIVGLGDRIEKFELFAQSGEPITTRKLAPGQFSAAAPAGRFKYEVKLAPPIPAANAAKISWLNADAGLLMLRDLLPLFETQDQGSRTPLGLRIHVPSGWMIQTGEIQSGVDAFAIDDTDRAVFAVGNRLRNSAKAVAGSKLNLIIQGEWAFTDAEAMDLAAKVFAAHQDVFGAAPKQSTLILLSYPQQVRPDNWSAETRGSTVTLLMGKLPSKVGALAQLSTPLTHELFHLWVPNQLALAGNYDWFYEGFTVYQAARTAVRLDLLTFPEFLNALGRAYDGYLNSIDRDRWSLVEASERRWTTGQSAVYAKSMVVAFLYDLRMRSESRGKRSLDETYRKVFQSYRLPENAIKEARPVDGNEVLINVLASDSAMQDFVRTFVAKPASINLIQELVPYGLTVETFGLRTRIAVSDQLNKQQRDLLRQLGYNDAVRGPRRGQKN